LRKLEEENIQAKWIELDVTKHETVYHAALKVLDEYDRLDILINNAAVYLDEEFPSQTRITKMRDTFETNFFGPFVVIQAFLPLLKKSLHGRIVNVSSRMGSFGYQLPNRNRLAYSTSKSALNMMTLQFDKEFRAKDWNIKINSVNPGKYKHDLHTFIRYFFKSHA
jgi:NAD(P)-dependent dehydrogenase (short-subunit alcohol dehydrogenase family)